MLVAFTAFISITSAFAAQEGYICTVAGFHRLSNAGTLSTEPKDPIIGQEFTVDRATGKVLGKYLTSAGFKTEVLDVGSGAQSFKVIAKSHSGFLHVLYLYVEEFSKNERKPFLLIDGSLVYSGTCS